MNQVNDRFAFQKGGHFFYPKEGETLNQNWIVENLNNAFSTWNGKLTELWGLVTTSPQTFKGGAVWGVMQSLHNAMIGIGYALIMLFFAISLFKNTANFHELKRPEAAVHYLIRFVAAKTLVGYGMDIMRCFPTASLSLCCGNRKVWKPWNACTGCPSRSWNFCVTPARDTALSRWATA